MFILLQDKKIIIPNSRIGMKIFSEISMLNSCIKKHFQCKQRHLVIYCQCRKFSKLRNSTEEAVGCMPGKRPYLEVFCCTFQQFCRIKRREYIRKTTIRRSEVQKEQRHATNEKPNMHMSIFD